MSNPLAIAAVTATLRQLLDQGLNADLPGTQVTTRPLDKARIGLTGNQVNLFLYQVLPNAAWRNLDPRSLTSRATGPPPLALNLFYLLSAYGQNEDDPEPLSHRLLGRVMLLFHEHPVLEPTTIQEVLADSALHEQGERLRVTLQPLSLDEMSKLWTTFQAPYRISVAYEVSVVLIEATPPSSQVPG